MLLWSIQHLKAYEELCNVGTLTADEKIITSNSTFIKAYQWMAEQMKARIGVAPKGVVFPLWAWYQWEGQRKRPDMRRHGRCWGEKGTPIVLLTLDIPKENVLLSDFDYWHVVLNDGDLIFPYSETTSYTEKEKRRSWENIFDITCSFEAEEDGALTTQATFWKIKKEWVLKAEHFLSR